jgi:hypothetical protein
MKINKFIMGCALAIGLTTFASNKVQAVVIDGELYVPITFSATFYSDGINDKIAKTRIDSKTILSSLGYSAKTNLLAYFEGDIYVITKTAVKANLTSAGILEVELDNYLDFGFDDDSEFGEVYVDYYSDGEGTDSPTWFEISGDYILTERFSDATDRESINFHAPSLGGYGEDNGVEEEEDLPVSGNASGSSSGKVD